MGESANVLRQAASTATTRLRTALLAGRNADGGWGYYPGKLSRLEPTCWAMLALGTGDGTREAAAWLARCQRPSGWLVEDPAFPASIGFNLLAAFVLFSQHDAALTDVRHRLLEAAIASKGLAAPQSEAQRQDNSLQGWSWIDATFSWVEPTCWGLLALKKARTTGAGGTALTARVAEAERLLIDRACRPGGWNYGNATVLGQELRPFVPTTALGLLAMQDRRGDEAVTRGLATLETIWREEISATSVGLSLLCFRVFSRPATAAISQMVDHVDHALAFGNHHGIAVALAALSPSSSSHGFRI